MSSPSESSSLAFGAPPKRLHEFVVEEIGSRIVRGTLRAGEALPVEVALAAELGVSRTVVREAIKVLAHKQLLTVRPRTGTRVSPAVDWNQLDPDVLRWRFAGVPDAKFVADVIDLRRIIEPAAAELAAARATPAAIRAIRASLQEMATTTDVRAHMAADLRFHLGILEATGNALVLGLRHGIEGALNFAIHLTAQTKEDAENTQALHKAVYDAIAARDPEAARAAMDRLVDRWSVKSRRIVGAKRQRNRRRSGA
jgi:DNA-binding FadR family transcriptional regulator